MSHKNITTERVQSIFYKRTNHVNTLGYLIYNRCVGVRVFQLWEFLGIKKL